MDNIICYCSKISRSEINFAVNNGAKTINDVRNFLDKNITGNCKTAHPLGICCHKEFLSVIDSMVNN